MSAPSPAGRGPTPTVGSARRGAADEPKVVSRPRVAIGDRPPSSAGGGRRGSQKRSAATKGDAATRGTAATGARKGAQGSARSQRGVARRAKRAERRDNGLGRYLVRPDIDGPRVRLGVLWFLVAVGAMVTGRWATTALWAAVAAKAAWEVTTVWGQAPRAAGSPGWAPGASALSAAAIVGAAGVGTSLAGVALIGVPLVVVLAHMAAGAKPAAAGPALIGCVLAAVPAAAVVLVARSELWAGLFLVVAVSFYDAGYFVAAAESSTRVEGPLTGVVGVLAVTFVAFAIEAAPFDRRTAWIAGGLTALACPLGQMLVSAHLPERDVRVGAMRRLDAYVVAAPLMLVSVWVLGT